jgi:hypothetical protein
VIALNSFSGKLKSQEMEGGSVNALYSPLLLHLRQAQAGNLPAFIFHCGYKMARYHFLHPAGSRFLTGIFFNKISLLIDRKIPDKAINAIDQSLLMYQYVKYNLQIYNKHRCLLLMASFA